ncbi:hypothetical protein SLA2020_169570 [Shorea laevis]
MEKQQQQQQQNAKKSKRSDPKVTTSKNLGTRSNDDASWLVGSIVEKGVASSQISNNKTTPPPQPTLLPFPVARHRSHGPHWNPLGNKNDDNAGDDEDEDEEQFADFDPIAAFAKPVQRKEKKGLNFSRWKEFTQSNDSSMTKEKEGIKSNVGAKHKKDGEATKTTNYKSFPKDFSVDHADEVASMEVDGELLSNSSKPSSKSEDAVTNELHFSAVTDMDLDNSHQSHLKENVQNASSDNLNREPTRSIYSKISAERMPRDDLARVQIESLEKMDSTVSTMPKTFRNFANEQGSMFLESEIDAENHARLESMSPEEIAQAQAEIMQRMDPALLNLLRKRGSEKLKKQKNLISNMGANSDLIITQNENQTNITKSHSDAESSDSQMATATNSINTKSGPENGVEQNLNPPNSSFWNTWSERVEAVRELRFSLDGTVVKDSFVYMLETGGEVSVNHRLTSDNVAERDFLRTEGDPGAAGYTIKEAVALTRSTVPGQRTLALHLLASVLEKAIDSINQKQIGCDGINDEKADGNVDWEAVWAYALGPEPELVLSLRISLDDNHNSVVLACAKVIQYMLSCDANEHFFDILKKVAINGKDIHTAPVFRSKPEIDVGFMHGGFWKYSAKPSNILPFGDDVVDDGTEGKHTIQDDIVVAGQDSAAGLVRMGILPRMRYLLETQPAAALEECIMSILIAIARHSPTSADAIMKCQRLIQTVVQRFTVNNNLEVYPSKIKSVCLLKVLARSDRKNCVEFIKNGIFQAMTWHLYQRASSLDQWLKLGRENCKLSSALMVEQLRFWKVCIQSGYCVSYFSNVFPALCLWLNPPSLERLIEVNVLSEFASITKEAFLVLEALAGRLPNFYSDKLLDKQSLEYADNDVETWCWSHVGPMIDLAVKWISLKSGLFDWQNGINGNFVNQDRIVSSLLWVYSAVMHMVSRVLEKVIPEDTTKLEKYGGHVPWLPEFVPKVGLEIIKNEFLSFRDVYGTEYGENFAGSSSFIEELCCLRQQCESETSLASASCLRGLVQVVISINNLIQRAEISRPQGCSFSREENLLASGILKKSLVEFRCVFDVFMKLITSESNFVQSVETFGRGGPAPGVGVGWGVPGGGFWSITVLLAEMDAGLLIQLLEIFHGFSIAESPADEEISFTMQKVNSALVACLTAGPRDIDIVEKAFGIMLKVPVLKYLDTCIRQFLQSNQRMKLFGWEYNEEDYLLFSNILTSHFKNRWLSIKRKSKVTNSSGKSKGNIPLETIPEDLEASDMTTQGHFCMSLLIEWAHQRLPLPTHWFLSPISTLCDSKHAGLKSASSIQNVIEEPSDILEVAKAGLFFLMGIEAMSNILSPNVPCPVQSVPLIWKLHSLSVILLVGMGLLEEEKSRDVYESLQELYGQLLGKERSKRITEINFDKSLNLMPKTGEKYGAQFLRFQSEIHESYSTFIDTLVEQYAAVSYGDLIYGRQVSVYLYRYTEVPVRHAAWNALSNARVLELLPPLQKCIGEAEGYLEPIEDDEGIMEAYVKSWTSSALDRAATRGSMAFTLVLHHLSCFVFLIHAKDKLLLRNKIVKSLLRDYSRKQQHEGMMLQFIQYNKTSTFLVPEEKEGLPLQRSYMEERFEILKEACEGNSSLLTVVEKLKSTFG